jgi:cell division protein FtsI (penicillin-binding protein 3)
VQPKIVRRTTSGNTAAVLTGIMESVVEEGTAKAAQIPGYTVAGKTGTATKLVNGRYSHADYNASFVGFVPSRNPAVTIIIVIDSPRGGSYYGGSVAAPIFKRIAEPTLRYLGVGPTINPGAPVLVAREGDSHESTSVPTSASSSDTPIVSLVADGPPGAVPDLHGLTAREAVRTLVKLGLVPRVSGDGFVVSQDPAPGVVVDPGAVCRLVLERSVSRSASAAQQP